MTLNKKSGDHPFAFGHREDLSNLPSIAKEHEVDLHGGFAIDSTGAGTVYYGMPGCGILPHDNVLQDFSSVIRTGVGKCALVAFFLFLLRLLFAPFYLGFGLRV